MRNVLPKGIVLVLLLTGCPLTNFSQGMRVLGIPLDTLLKTSTPRVDRAYITTYYRRLHLYVVSDRQDYTLRVLGRQQSLVYKPNLAWTLGLGIDYKWIGTEITVKLPFLGYNIAQRGKTKPFGATVNLNNRRFWFSAQYQFYRGFYLNNPDVLQSDWFDHHAAYPYRNDLRTQTVISHVLYQFNPLRVSVPATLLQREGQRRNAGTWVIGGFATYQHVQGDSSWVPTALQKDFSAESGFHRLNTLALGVEAGYTQTFVFKNHWFSSFTLRPGMSVLFQQSIGERQIVSTHWRAGWEGVASVTVGYSTDIFYGGVYGSSTLINRAFSRELVSTDVDYFRLVVGKRIRYQPKGIIKQIPGIK
ncbi:DUF4421 family protein [Spirosoma soli]|uniref:DUF4421 family protein n=1 Tax=Spirosoma soli TaxID=1770529 RepID=A0ABW5M6T5_9BACT